MDKAVTEALLDERWSRVLQVVLEKGGNVERDVWRDGVNVHARVHAHPRKEPAIDGTTQSVRDPYVFRLDYTDYDDHGPRTRICDPEPPHEIAQGLNHHPDFANGHPFGRADFFCMPGDRRCQDSSNHPEWAKKEHYHPEVIIASLWDTFNRTDYKGRRAT